MKYNILIIIALLLGSCTWLNWNPLASGMMRFSDTIEQSKEYGIFIEEYEIDTLETDSEILKALQPVEIWTEYDAISTSIATKVEIDTNKPNECFSFTFKPKTFDEKNLAYINKFITSFVYYKEKNLHYRFSLRSYLKRNLNGVYFSNRLEHIENNKAGSKITIQYFENDSCIYKMVFNKKE